METLVSRATRAADKQCELGLASLSLTLDYDFPCAKMKKSVESHILVKTSSASLDNKTINF